MTFPNARSARGLLLLVAVVSASRLVAGPAEPYFDGGLIRFDASINLQPASFFYDTSASGTALFAAGAERLKIPFETSEEISIAGEKVATACPPR